MRKQFCSIIAAVLLIGACGAAPGYAATTNGAVTPPVHNLTPNSPTVQPITRGDPTRPLIALTFDACQALYQTPGYDAKLINELINTHTPATLFLGGIWMQSHPAQTKALAANPLFELGEHSWDHADFDKLSAALITTEINETQALMFHLTGRTATLFRFPYGRYTPQAVKLIAQTGLTSVQWDVVSGDPDPHVTAQRMIAAVTHRTRDGSIIIMHMNGRGWHTAEALPQIITTLRAQGFQFVTVSQLLGRAPIGTSTPVRSK